jgi:cytosine/adenosine deaminase-related metal-dependent hydrolase
VPSSIVRGKYVITRTLDRHSWEQIEDGAVLHENGIIADVGSFAGLAAKYPDVPVFGSGREVLLPGFVNGHHHLGLTPLQLGSPDMPLELWLATRLVMRSVDPYLDTLYSAFEMIASGITTVQHIHSWSPGGVPQVEARAGDVIRAYQDIGMRVSYCFALRDQNHMVYEPNAAFLKRLPEEIRPMVQRHLDRFGLTSDDYVELFDRLHRTYTPQPRVKV